MEHALELVPDILGDERVGIRHAINGLIALTPDGNPILGETPEVKGLWSVAASWIKEAPGIAKTVAEWMTDGNPEIDPHGSDIARFYDHHRTAVHIRARADEGFNKTYGIVHPMEQWASNRDVRLTPMNARQRELGAVFFEAAGLGAADVVHEQRAAARRVRRPGRPPRGRVGRPLVVADHQRRAPRDARPGRDGRPVGVRDLRRVGSGRASPTSRASSFRPVDVPVGRVIYTPLLSEAGGIVADLTIMRLAHDRFRVVTGGGMGMRDKKWFTDHLPEDGSATLADVTSAWTTIGIWGPRARDVVASITTDDVSNAGFPFATCRVIDLGPVRVLASRISYVGELGWELYAPMEEGLRLWDLLAEAGSAHGIVPVGIGVYATTARLEKGYRAHGNELELDFDLVEAGMARPRVKEQPFLGRAAYLAQRERPPAAVLCTLTVDSGVDSSGVRRAMLGREPILTPDGQPLTDAKGRRSYVTSAGAGPSVGQAPADVVPAAGARGRGRHARGRVLRRAAPGDRRGRRLAPAVRPGQRAYPELTTSHPSRCADADDDRPSGRPAPDVESTRCVSGDDVAGRHHRIGRAGPQASARHRRPSRCSDRSARCVGAASNSKMTRMSPGMAHMPDPRGSLPPLLRLT